MCTKRAQETNSGASRSQILYLEWVLRFATMIFGYLDPLSACTCKGYVVQLCGLCVVTLAILSASSKNRGPKDHLNIRIPQTIWFLENPPCLGSLNQNVGSLCSSGHIAALCDKKKGRSPRGESSVMVHILNGPRVHSCSFTIARRASLLSYCTSKGYHPQRLQCSSFCL